jgi:hypothetical protein
MSIYEQIKNMSIDELAVFILSLTKKGFQQIDDVFCRKLCNLRVKGSCELAESSDFSCPYNDDDKTVVKLYLESEV